MAGVQKRAWGMAIAALAAGVGCTGPGMAQLVGGPAVDVPPGGGAGAAVAPAQGPLVEALSRSDTYFMTQYYHKRWNPTQRAVNNANCGPTSLAMAAKAFGKLPAGTNDADPAGMIRAVRRAMTGTVDEGTWTYPVQVEEGARRLGLHARTIYGVGRIRQAMAVPGRLVVVNLNPSPAYVEQLIYRYDGGHFALLTGIEGDRVHLSDPLGKEPLTITLAQLEQALTTPLGNDPDGRYVPPFNGGVLLWE